MLKMIKWIAITTVSVGAIGFLAFGSEAGSYLDAAFTSARNSVKEKIPVEFELKRAEQLIRDIEPEIRECKRDLARSEVELEHLMSSVEHLEEEVATEQQMIRARSQQLRGNGGDGYQLTGSYRRRSAEIELGRLLDSCKSNKAILETKRRLIENQTKAVVAAKQRLTKVTAEKARLEDQIRSLKTQKKMLDSLVVESERFDLDDSALSQAREALAEVQKRLDVTQRMLENETFFDADELGSGDPDRDVLQEVEEFFASEGAARQDRKPLGRSH